MLEPETSVSSLVDVITLLGCFSGYKINFSKSLALEIELKHYLHSHLNGTLQVLSTWAFTLHLCFMKC